MRQQIRYLAAALMMTTAINAHASLYEECLDKNYMSDNAMAGCNDDEANRIMAQIRKRMNSIAATRYFNNWASSKDDFNKLLSEWEKFRDDYCSLNGYAYTQGKGTISVLQTSKCRIDMNKRFLDDVEMIVKIYQENRT